jgi:hypothetical protein
MMHFVPLWLSMVVVFLTPWIWRIAVRENFWYQTMGGIALVMAWTCVLIAVKRALGW